MRIRQSSLFPRRTVQITSGSNSLHLHQTGRIPIETELPLYGIVILSDAVSHCEVTDESFGSFRNLTNRITDLGMRQFQAETEETLNRIEQRLPTRRLHNSSDSTALAMYESADFLQPRFQYARPLISRNIFRTEKNFN